MASSAPSTSNPPISAASPPATSGSEDSFKTAEEVDLTTNGAPVPVRPEDLNRDEKIDYLIRLVESNTEVNQSLKATVATNEKNIRSIERAATLSNEVIDVLKINNQIIWQQSEELAQQILRTHRFVENKADEILKDTQETLREERNLVIWDLKLEVLEEFRENDQEEEGSLIQKLAFTWVNKHLSWVEPIDVKAKKLPNHDGDDPATFRMMITFSGSDDANKFKIRLNNEGHLTVRKGMSKLTRRLCTKYKVLADTLNKNETDPNVEYRTKYQFSLLCHAKGKPDEIISLDSALNPSEPYRLPKLREVELLKYPSNKSEGEEDVIDLAGEEMEVDAAQNATKSNDTHKRKRSQTAENVEEDPQTKRIRALAHSGQASQDVRQSQAHYPPPPPPNLHQHHPRPHPYHQQPQMPFHRKPFKVRGNSNSNSNHFQNRQWRGHGHQRNSFGYQHGNQFEHPPPPRGKKRGRPPTKNKGLYKDLTPYYSTNLMPIASHTPRHPAPASAMPHASTLPPTPSTLAPDTATGNAAAAASSASVTPTSGDNSSSNRGSEPSVAPGYHLQLSQTEMERASKVPVTFNSLDKETLKDSLRYVYKNDMALKLTAQHQELLAIQRQNDELKKELQKHKLVLQAPAHVQL